jgi:4-hydroxybenzoate polyprenyltransferase
MSSPKYNNVMEKIKVLIKTSRPLGWPIAPIIFVCGLLYSGAQVTGMALFQMLLLSFPACILLYGINDIYDYESDRINPRKTLIEGVMLEKKDHGTVKKASFLFALVAMVSSLMTFNPFNMLSMVLLLFFSYYYSAPPIRLKNRPPFDSFSNGMLFLFVAMLGFSYGGTVFTIPLKVYFVAACVMGAHSLTTVMDYSVDRKVGEKTMAVAFGKRAAALLSLTVFSATLFFSGIQTPEFLCYLAFAVALSLVLAIIPTERAGRMVFKVLYAGFMVTMLVYLTRTLPVYLQM